MYGKLFKPFLVLYTVVLLYHLAHLHVKSWQAIAGLVAGLILAIFAHMRRGYGTIVLLLIHMAIEWSEYAQQGKTYSGKEIAFYGIHTILDFTFLWHEVRVHLPKFRYMVIGSAAFGLSIIYISVRQIGSGSVIVTEHDIKTDTIEALVIGGILGCTLSHLFQKRRLLGNT